MRFLVAFLLSSTMRLVHAGEPESYGEAFADGRMMLEDDDHVAGAP
ncbi:hypothetical protein [Luteimonas terricola]|uniref:Uncharacterized protein n=1 Tax=Luteimonas terricola TaxID=645597 RepID=A0ABQ2EAD9_9GAMM|nr:hypothetical protein [Luteimonas terricola]GGK03672.1 hypothetical protein GCM10011394_10810 [Luteimonas terricola]